MASANNAKKGANVRMKRKERKNIAAGQAHIQSTFNNTVVTITDLQGNAIEKSGRALPIGYWKGSGLSILLDLIATLLSGGNAVHTIGTFGDEIGLTQIMIAIDPTKFGTVEENDAVIDAILADIKASTPARPDGEVRWPGEGMLRTIKENRELGVPVVEEIWESVLKM